MNDSQDPQDESALAEQIPIYFKSFAYSVIYAASSTYAAKFLFKIVADAFGSKIKIEFS